jgi:hypothetical protein
VFNKQSNQKHEWFAIQKLAGHERLETTRINVKLGTEDLRPMMEATSL